MKKIIACALLLLALALTGCGSDEKQPVKVNGKYMVELPGFLNKTTDLNDEASLQYANVFREFYVIVIDEPRKAFDDYMDESDYGSGLEGFAEFLISDLAESTGVAETPALEKVKIGSLDGYTASFSSAMDGTDVYWKITYIGGKEDYYQLLTWTLEENREKYTGQMEEIQKSFKEISKGRK